MITPWLLVLLGVAIANGGVTKERNSSRVVIVGAGAAGLAASKRLLDHGFDDFIILEANDRVGGRIHSVRFGDAIIDLGAEYCAGEGVYNLVKDLGVLKPKGTVSNGYHSTSGSLEPTFTNGLFGVHSILESAEKDNRSSRAAHIQKFFKSAVVQIYGDEHERHLAYDCVDLIEKINLIYASAFFLEDLSAADSHVDYPGKVVYNWNGHGFQTVLRALLKDHNLDDRINLNSAVRKIEWGSEEVKLTTSNGAEFFAEHVILTPSLGVLKHKRAISFYPPLPAEKVDAIDMLGYGTTNAIALYFPERWWTNPNMVFIFSKTGGGVSGFTEGPRRNGKSWLDTLFGFTALEQNPNALFASFTGEFAPDIELCSDDVIIDGIMYAIRKFVGVNATRPTKWLRRNWYHDPSMRGTYSYETVRSWRNGAARENLAKPLASRAGRPQLLFAGEAAHREYYATVHGAFETGYREAERIINCYGPTKKN
ncbi:hypothetical protein PPYR_08111 [Photinus pyralis]|uniref:Amine oxidase domain-containing protein n=1 Tax=Photinus pyralis TaxID=7054 RepID=A0A1Y1NFS1_PHOPY|nr:spermine oxidase-like [Photinus pyralis]KAB0797117.1 hypothetical protein PPYR_08111 [Photinus pyralis]